MKSEDKMRHFIIYVGTGLIQTPNISLFYIKMYKLLLLDYLIKKNLLLTWISSNSGINSVTIFKESLNNP